MTQDLEAAAIPDTFCGLSRTEVIAGVTLALYAETGVCAIRAFGPHGSVVDSCYGDRAEAEAEFSRMAHELADDGDEDR